MGFDPDVAVARTVDGVLRPQAVAGTVGVFRPDVVPLVGVCPVVEGPAEPVPCAVPVIFEKFSLHD